jgi:hypothetical protein
MKAVNSGRPYSYLMPVIKMASEAALAVCTQYASWVKYWILR